MSTQLDVDIAVLVGELAEVPCEAAGHHEQHPSNGPATHYARVTCPGCSANTIKTYCNEMVLRVSLNMSTKCQCGDIRPALEAITILGPVNK